MKYPVSIVFAVSAIFVSGPALAALPGTCLRAGDVADFHPLPGNEAIILTDAQQDKFKITLSKACTNLHHHMEITLKSSSGGGRCIKHGDYVLTRRVGSPAGKHGARCMIDRIEAFNR